MKKILICTLLITITLFGASKPNTFNKAKEQLKRIYAVEKPYEFYTNTKIKIVPTIKLKPVPYKPVLDFKLLPTLTDVGYSSTKYLNRQNNIEWEHIVPAYYLRTVDPDAKNAWENGHSLCITSSGRRYKGRDCAAKVSEKFVEAESDMVNLVPSIGALNAMRRNYMFDIIDGEKRDFGNIDFELDSTLDVVEPRPEIRGQIGRIVLYMVRTYGVMLDNHKELISLMMQWDELFPISEWEQRKIWLLNNKYSYNITGY